MVYINDVPAIEVLALTMIRQFTKDKTYNLVKQYPVSAKSTVEELKVILKSIKRNARGKVLLMCIIEGSSTFSYI